MNIKIPKEHLSQYEFDEISRILSMKKDGLTDLEQIWYLMDLIWDEIGCDNKKLDWDKVSEFYAHPVWLLNGFFIEQDSLSMQHRKYISEWVLNSGATEILDYGGGFFTLATLIASTSNDVNVDVYEPHPNDYALNRIDKFENIRLVSNLQKKYDCLVCTDVLEHVYNPLNNLFDMVKCVKNSGYLIIANAFYPMIKCHLPCTFHFRYTFSLFTMLMGLKKIGLLEGSHAIIYEKINDNKPNWLLINFFEKLSKIFFQILIFLKKIKIFFKESLL